MSLHDREKIVAAASDAGIQLIWDGKFGREDYQSIMGSFPALERFYAIAAASRDVEVAYLQSRIDELMLEYCPDDMTKEQLANWAANQRPVDESYVDPDANKTSAQLRAEGRAYCPKCYTFGDSHNKDCPHKNDGMSKHVRRQGEGR